MPNLFLTDAETLQLREIVSGAQTKDKNLLTPEHISLKKIGIKIETLCLSIQPKKGVKK